MINRNCLQKSEEVGKNLKSNKNFNFNKKITLINIARITKQAKIQICKEKGKEGRKEGRIEVRKFRKNGKSNKNFSCNINSNNNKKR